MRYVKGILFLTLILFLFTHCEEKYTTFHSIVVVPKGNTSSGDTTMIDSVGKFEFSRISKVGVGGLSGFSWIGPEHKNKKLCIVFEGRIRTNLPQSFATISFALNGDSANELLQWRATSLKYFVYDVNKWCPFRDSIFLEPDVKGKPYQKITAIAFEGNAQGENFDMDTLRVWFKEKK